MHPSPDQERGLIGRWRPVNLDVVVDSRRTGGALVGTVVESAAEPAYVGGVLLRHFRLDASGRRWRGEVYVVRRRIFVPATIAQTNVRMFELTAESGIASTWLNWVRA